MGLKRGAIMDIRTQRLNEAFNASGMTQKELCDKTGITKGAVSSYLSGRYFPKQKTIELLANALNVSIPYLMGYEEVTADENGIVADISIEDKMLIEKIHKLSPTTRYMLNGIIDSLLAGDQANDTNNR